MSNFNPQSLLMAMEVNVGDVDEQEARAKLMEIPGIESVPESVLDGIKKKYGLLGQVSAYRRFRSFLQRIKSTLDAEEAQQKAESEANRAKEEAQSAAEVQPAGEAPAPGQELVGVKEDQYKQPNGLHRRNQSAHPSNFTGAKSFGGVGPEVDKKKKKKKLSIESKLAEILIDSLTEEVTVQGNEAVLMAEEGRLVVDGEVVINNHADLLSALTMWMMNERPETMKNAVDGLGEMSRDGTFFK